MDIISNNRREVKYFFINFSFFFANTGFFTERTPRDKIKTDYLFYMETAMKEFTITQNDAGQRLDRWLAKAVPLLPASLAQKYIRLKRIKLNGKRAERDTRLTAGDTLQLYINDEFFDTPKEENAYLTVAAPKLHIVYEDKNLLLVDKKPGQAVHPHDGAEYGKTLIDHIQAYLYANREWRPREEHAFAPALCNRIDRNTGGIVIAAKNAEALRILNQKIKDREIDKRYFSAARADRRNRKAPSGLRQARGAAVQGREGKPRLHHENAAEGFKDLHHILQNASEPERAEPCGVRACDRAHPSDPRAFSTHRLPDSG